MSKDNGIIGITVAITVGVLSLCIASALAVHDITAAIDRNTEIQHRRMCFDHPDLFDIGYTHCAEIRR